MIRLKSEYIWFPARVFIGLVFFYAGFQKLIEPVENFRGVIAEYQVLSYGWVGAAAAGVPWAEVFAGAFLVLGFLPRPAALLASLLSLGFLLLLGLSYWKLGKFPDSCGCFGEGGIKLTVPQVIALDTLNFFLGLRLFFLKGHPLSLSSWFRGQKA
ncbi:MAG: DoxX family protein [candidate division Zixibacteria bacterium]|nr:DoxX family protein [candidate division Zixibacteria bacterium]